MTTQETRERLLASAALIPKPDGRAVKEYSDRQELLAAQVSAVLAGREDVEALVGAGNTDMMRDNHRNHARFMASFLRDFEPEPLVDTLAWVYRTYQAHGFSGAYWPVQLTAWITVLEEHLTPDSLAAIRPLYEWMLDTAPAFSEPGQPDGD